MLLGQSHVPAGNLLFVSCIFLHVDLEHNAYDIHHRDIQVLYTWVTSNAIFQNFDTAILISCGGCLKQKQKLGGLKQCSFFSDSSVEKKSEVRFPFLKSRVWQCQIFLETLVENLFPFFLWILENGLQLLPPSSTCVTANSASLIMYSSLWLLCSSEGPCDNIGSPGQSRRISQSQDP